MLRTLLLLIALLILIVIGLVALGVVNINPNRDGGVTLETPDVDLGTTERNVQLPVIKLENRTVEVPSVGVDVGNESQANGQ